MARSAEVIRQWNIIRALDGARVGAAVQDLAASAGVSVRTIWRDLAALQEAGFPLYDEKVDGRALWHLDSTPFRHLEDRGFTLTQLCALYFSRTLVECLAGTPFQQDLQSAFNELGRTLPPRMREFFDRIPAVIDAKRGPMRVRAGELPHETIARLLDATLHQRAIEMRYHSASSARTKRYTVEPYRSTICPSRSSVPMDRISARTSPPGTQIAPATWQQPKKSQPFPSSPRDPAERRGFVVLGGRKA